MDAVLSRLTDLVLTIPVLAILLVFAARVSTRRGNTVLIALAIAGVTWPGIFRVVRSTFLSLREREWVEAARAVGATERRIVVRHLLPAAAGPIIVAATLTVAWAIVAEAALGFLGFGISSPDVSLGYLVQQGQVSSTNRPWLFYFPGLVLLVTCLCVNFVGDGLRAAIDPRDRRPAGRLPARDAG